jgi:hypothetical protein
MFPNRASFLRINRKCLILTRNILQQVGTGQVAVLQANQQNFHSINELPWIQVAAGAPYFITDTGRAWTPVGQNDALIWPELAGLFRRQDLPGVRLYLQRLQASGVTCLRLMLEYCQTENRYLEKPAGKFQPHMVRFWDDLFLLCHQYGLRILLTPFDTYWMWRRWKYHPYNHQNGGPCRRRTRWLCCPATRQAIKDRLTFAAERWGGSGVLFAWDLWNEIHPAQAGKDLSGFADLIADLSSHLRDVENRCHGRSHLQTVSVFGPDLEKYPALKPVIYRHPVLDFATSHFYDASSIDNPKDTIRPALCVGALVREALGEVSDPYRPFLDSEHGPIQAYKRRRRLPRLFDEQYFHHMQWAHVAAGGAGGGLRWPYRQPHVLTGGMRQAQKSLADFVKLVDWTDFERRNLNQEIRLSCTAFAVFACGDARQAIIWLLRQDQPPKGPLSENLAAVPVTVAVPGLEPGKYRVIFWDTRKGEAGRGEVVLAAPGELSVAVPPVSHDLALAVIRY